MHGFKLVAQKKKGYLKILLSYLACSQNLLKLLVDHCHFGYNTKLTQNKREREREREDVVRAALLYNLVPYHNLIQNPLFAGLVFNHKLVGFHAAAPSPA
jgi:hypothetical protein